MAMIFMVLIGMLALGFYSSITTSKSVANNDQKGARALVAAESGIQFMRLRLAHVQLPALTTSDQVLGELFNDLKVSSEVLGNLGTNTVGFANGTISIPAEAGQIIVTDSAGNSGFAVKIARISPTVDGIACTITGHTGTGRAPDARGAPRLRPPGDPQLDPFQRDRSAGKSDHHERSDRRLRRAGHDRQRHEHQDHQPRLPDDRRDARW